MSTIFETLMLVCFGAAWPASIHKSWTSRTNKGKSLKFLLIILLGYTSGILFKVTGRLDAVIFLYSLNMVLVTTDVVIFFRNARIDRRTASGS
ncbi:hypothetical protein KKF84_01310 [Myxococcota bacterium]|nr:hypothetical protein [Myxococcota bacterium]MBU1533922.1 hypothetical protein [Myxococcota bacterium]